MVDLFLPLAVLWLAWSNGANDNFKGVATLYGSGALSFGAARSLSMGATLLGSLVSVALARRLARAFSGKGILADGLIDPTLLLAVGGGASATVFLATLLGLPTSTTHALTGALVGAGLAGGGAAGVCWRALVQTVAQPLLLSPLVAIAVTWPVHRYLGRMPRLRSLEALHALSGTAVCFARAVNDTPKMAALLLVGGGLGSAAAGSAAAFLLVGLVMVAGGWLQTRRVAETMSRRITSMDQGQGLSANLVTAFLVLIASRHGLPVSTTHVSCGSIFGVGLAARRLQGSVLLQILAAWIATLPLALLFGASLYALPVWQT